MKPIDMHTNIDKEWEYIRMKTEELNDIKRKQILQGLYNYKPGDKLRIHLEYSKTNNKFDERRRQFDLMATFIEYVGGNCKVKITRSLSGVHSIAPNKIIEVPIYFTKRVK